MLFVLDALAVCFLLTLEIVDFLLETLHCSTNFGLFQQYLTVQSSPGRLDIHSLVQVLLLQFLNNLTCLPILPLIIVYLSQPIDIKLLLVNIPKISLIIRRQLIQLLQQSIQPLRPKHILLLLALQPSLLQFYRYHTRGYFATDLGS